jgi:hypothetical protein
LIAMAVQQQIETAIQALEAQRAPIASDCALRLGDIPKPHD